MFAQQLIWQIVVPIVVMAERAGCENSPTDGAAIDAEIVVTPVADINPQGLFRSVSAGSED